MAYIGPNSRTERLRKTKIGTEVAHVTRDSDTTFKVKRSNFKVSGGGIVWRPHYRPHSFFVYVVQHAGCSSDFGYMLIICCNTDL